jgi:hypothetical protein
MSVYIDLASRLNHDQAENLAVTCPHCQVVAHITPVAVPRFEDLAVHKPRQVGVVYLCDNCHAPIFLRFTVRSYGPARIELAPQFTEVERAREKFTYTYLPEEVEAHFKEALLCFSSAAYNAFASMCRRTAQAVFADLGETGRLRIYDELNDVRAMAELDVETFTRIKSVLFGNDSDPRPNAPLLESYAASVLLEIMKDLLYEAYVRKGKLQQAMMVRRFFVDEKASRVTPLVSSTVGGGVK